MQTITANNYTTQLNNFGICSIILSSYNKDLIAILKHNDFRYFSKTKEWSKAGFTDLNTFNTYLIALFNNDTKLIKKLSPKKNDVIKQCIALKIAGRESKKNYINFKNNEKIAQLEKVFDSGVANIILEYCRVKKIDFWNISPEEIKAIILKNDNLLNDIIEFNKINDVITCDFIIDAINESLPF